MRDALRLSEHASRFSAGPLEQRTATHIDCELGLRRGRVGRSCARRRALRGSVGNRGMPRRRSILSRGRRDANGYRARNHRATAIGARGDLARRLTSLRNIRDLARMRHPNLVLHRGRRCAVSALMVRGAHEIAGDQVQVQQQHPDGDGGDATDHTRIVSTTFAQSQEQITCRVFPR
jgi:hypothetical protein